MMTILANFVIVLIFISIGGDCVLATPQERPDFGLLPAVYASMQTPGFWVARLESPDKVLMDAKDIDAYNSYLSHTLKLTKDIFTVTDDLGTETLLDQLNSRISGFMDKGLYTAEGKRDDKAFLDKVKFNMHLTGVVMGMAPRYGLVVTRTDQRLLPTESPLYEKPYDIYFDQVQQSGLEVGEPVAIVHTSRDRQWVYVYGPISDGWVRADHVAVGEKKTVEKYARSADFVVVVAPQAEIFSDPGMTQWVANARMGTRFPLVGRDGTMFLIQFPCRDAQGKIFFQTMYMDAAYARDHFLPLTQRSLIQQAFRWLHTPYGWGDMQGNPDCSRLTASVYAAHGVILPRDSKDQALAGETFADFSEESSREDKKGMLKQAPVGSLLCLRGHIMLFLGEINGKAYAIHATSGYREKQGDQDVTKTLMRVVVSDLSLGEGSHKGSLLKRLNKIIVVKVPDAH